MWLTPHGFANRDKDGKVGGAAGELNEQARLWQTPSTCARGPEERTSKAKRPETGGVDLQTEAQNWPTPDANTSARSNGLMGPNLREASCRFSPPAPATSTAGGKSSPGTRRLNPRFVEWLMGWPRGWTAFRCSATEWCRWKRRMRSRLCWLVSNTR
ncbi:MAG TPA: hypothetical protein VFH53_00950 [Phycisphaerae bacterium]|nr:hypothetical protein [Phycisphaerae bacterium]